jgi:hypothetical protein
MGAGQSKSVPAPHFPRSGQIWLVRQPLLPGATDPHYALITRVSPEGLRIWINFITTSGDPERDDDFCIRQDTSDFAATGLKHTSHLRRAQYFDLRTARFDGVYRGYLTGELKKQVEEWFGEAF